MKIPCKYRKLQYPQGTNKCPEPESNQRHEDFQSSALPTELSGHLVAGIGFENADKES